MVSEQGFLRIYGKALSSASNNDNTTVAGGVIEAEPEFIDRYGRSMTEDEYAKIHNDRLSKAKEQTIKEVVAVRFFSDKDNSLSKKRYSYFTDIEDLELGDHVIVSVSGKEKTVVVVASCTQRSAIEYYVSYEERKKATKWILRRATKQEIDKEYK